MVVGTRPRPWSNSWKLEVVAIGDAPLLLVLLVAGLSGPITLVAGWRRPWLASMLAVAFATISFIGVWILWQQGGGAVDLPWIPSLGLRFSLSFDGVSAIYGLLATGIGAAVLLYSAAYIPRHLAHHHRDPRDATVFYTLILLFMGAMVGLVAADDLVLLFLFWDITAVVSYFLISFDRDEPSSRPAALMALMVTGGAAILMLAGIIVLRFVYGTTSIAALIALEPEGEAITIAMVLIAIAAIAKSAQVPLHFWLPRAMVAPTPVSSYLHSAAMVAAGVFLIARLLPLVGRAAWLPQALIAIGLGSIIIGGTQALSRDDIKRVLAYSTIGQYGYVLVLLGLGGKYGAIGAALYVVAHAMAKCALFLTAGAITEATGERSLSELGGLAPRMPTIAVASGIAAATIAALPLTIGFFKDELFFAAMYAEGTAFATLAIVAAGLTFAYIARFWGGMFLGSARLDVSALPVAMIAPIVVLAAVCLMGGLRIGPFNDLANAGGSASVRESVSVNLAYHLDTRPENIMAVAAYALGGGILLTLRFWSAISMFLAALSDRVGPDRLYRWAVDATNVFSDRIHDYEIHDLRGRIAWVLVPVGIFVLMGLLFTSNENAYLVGSFEAEDALIVIVLGVLCLSAIAVTRVTSHLAASVLLSAIGFPLAAIYAFLGAPDVALVAVLVETMTSILFIGFLAAMRDRPVVEGFEDGASISHRGRDRLIGIAAGAAGFVVVWGVLSKPSPIELAAEQQIELTPAAHAKDVVTAILTDFRGLDTMGEITVIGITLVGLITLLQRPSPRRSRL